MAPPILPDHNNDTQPHQNRFLTPQRLAEFLGMNVTFIYERLRPDHQDRIPHLRFGRKIKILGGHPKAAIKGHLKTGQRN